MKNKLDVKRLGIFVIALVAVILVIVLIVNMTNKTTLSIKDKDNVVKIVSQRVSSDRKVEISSTEMIKTVVDYIFGEKRTTKKKSISDTPVDVQYYSIQFKESNDVIYMYTKNDKYYIEKPYDGIYNITQEEYNNILKYLYLD